MSLGAQWADLGPRVLSGLVLVLIGGIEIWLGGIPFSVLLCGLAGLMIWEAAMMFEAPDARRSGILAAFALALSFWLPGLFAAPLFVALVIVIAQSLERERGPFAGLALAVLVGCYAIGQLRDDAGLVWVVWLVCVVIISDVAGYFAGRHFGGPKFWPSISPKKTWSGTVAGWIGAMSVGLIFAVPTGAGLALVPVSVFVSFSGQMGDIAESAVKRLRGVKDSSNLIPGHGGLLDRFDAMLGAAIVVAALRAFGLLPGAA